MRTIRSNLRIVSAGKNDCRGRIIGEPAAAESRRFRLHAGSRIQDYSCESADCRGARGKVVSSLLEIRLEIAKKIDLVDVFRRPEYVDEIVEQAIHLKIPAIWLQEDVIDERQRRRRARQECLW